MAQRPDTCSPASPITWPCRTSVSLQLASGRSRFQALQCGTIFRLVSHQRLTRDFQTAPQVVLVLSVLCRHSCIIPDSHSLLLSLHLCRPSNNLHYLGHTKNDDDDGGTLVEIFCSFSTSSVTHWLSERLAHFVFPAYCLCRIC